MTEETFGLSHLARVKPVTDVAALLRILEEREVLFDASPESLYFWRAEISNDLLDSHFTHMNEKTLRNYAEDATVGVAFLKSHNRYSLPVGYSLQASVENSGSKKRVVADFYTVRGLQETDDLIARMEGRILRDVSVGFNGGDFWCDICRQTFWDCFHYPGMKYEVKDGDKTKTVVATYEIDDARLSEVSGVYDGSTPDAMIAKAQRHAAAGLIDSRQVAILEQTYRVHLPHKTTHAVNFQRETKMEEKDLEKLRTVVGASLDEHIIPMVEALVRDNAELKPLAEQGRQYHADEVQRALEQGVRAFGNEFQAEEYEGVLKGSSIKAVQRFAADWKKVADKGLPAGRQSSESGGEPPEKPKSKSDYVPDEAYA